MKSGKLVLAACGVCCIALAVGMAAALVWGGALPGWLLALILLFVLGAALVYGYTGFVPRIGPWLKLRPVRGAIFVCLAVACVFVPLTFVISALLLGYGARQVWLAVEELERESPPATTTVVSPGRDIDVHANGAVPATQDEPKDMAPARLRR